MQNQPVIDVAGTFPADLTTRADLWPAGPQRSGGHMTAYGLGAFSSHSEYPSRTAMTVCDSAQRLHLSVWLRDGIDVNADGLKFRVEGRDSVAGYLPGAPWRTDFGGYAHHVGLLLHPDVLKTLAGEQGETFFEGLLRDGCLRVRSCDLTVLRAAQELDSVLLSSQSSSLLREAKSLELLARMIQADSRQDFPALTVAERARLDRACALLLADLSRPPTIAQLAQACGLSTLRLKRGFKQRFGLPVYAFYQQKRMRLAWDLIATGHMKVAEAGHQLGYTNMSHFATSFRKTFGMLPSEVTRRSCEPVNVPWNSCGEATSIRI